MDDNFILGEYDNRLLGTFEDGEQRGASPAEQTGIKGTFQEDQPNLIQAHIALLDKEFVSSNDEAFLRITRYYPLLRKWHQQHTEWSVERRKDVFRLMRRPSALTSGYSHSKNKLSAQYDFVYLIWILWYAANDQVARRGNDQLFLLAQMIDNLSAQWSLTDHAEALTLDMSADLRSKPQVITNRHSMARALRYLQELGCLEELDGQIANWVESDRPVLYQFTNTIHLLIMSLDLEALKAVSEYKQKVTTLTSSTIFTDMKDSQSALTRAWRSLLIGPSLLRFDDQEAFEVLRKNAVEVQKELVNTFGWSLEINHDYACIVRITGSTVPGTVSINPKNAGDQIVLLLCDAVRTQVATGVLKPYSDGCIETTTLDLADLLDTMRERFGDYWGKGMSEKPTKGLLHEALRTMRHIGLSRGPDSKGKVFILPTAARYGPKYAESLQGITAPNIETHKNSEESAMQQIDLWTDIEETEDN